MLCLGGFLPRPWGPWPSAMGFQYFYGFLGIETDQWEPYLFRDQRQIRYLPRSYLPKAAFASSCLSFAIVAAVVFPIARFVTAFPFGC
jgi:hypothetical protein